MRQPERTCVGCGQKRPKRELVRLVLEGGRVQVDAAQTRAGRGAYLCSAECVRKAVSRRSFGRAFRGAADVGEVEALCAGVRTARRW